MDRSPTNTLLSMISPTGNFLEASPVWWCLDQFSWGPPLRQPHQTPIAQQEGLIRVTFHFHCFLSSSLSLPSFVNSTLDLKSKSSAHDVSPPSIYARLVSILFWYVQNYVFPWGKNTVVSYVCIFNVHKFVYTNLTCTHICVFNVHKSYCTVHLSLFLTFSLSIKVLFMLLIIYEALANRYFHSLENIPYKCFSILPVRTLYLSLPEGEKMNIFIYIS